MRNSVFDKVIKLVMTNKRKNKLISKSNYYTTKFLRKSINNPNEQNKM